MATTLSATGAPGTRTGGRHLSLALLAGGFATSQAWLLAARAVQGAGGAIVAPTALRSRSAGRSSPGSAPRWVRSVDRV